MFNEHILPHIGEYEERIVASREAVLIAANEPAGTRSEEVHYFNRETGEEVARVHRFVRPDGTLAASGLPDPKRAFVNGILYRIVKKKNR